MSQIDTILTLIAQKHLGIDTLQTRHADSLDFHDTAVWCHKDALEAAFKAGVELGASSRKPRKRRSPRTDRETHETKRKALGFTPEQRVHHIVIHHPRRSSP